MTEAPPAQDNASLQDAELAASMAIFEEAHAGRPANNGAANDPPVVTKAEPAKAKAAELAPAADEFPAEVLEGKPSPAAPDPEAEEKADMELIKQRPTGQIKHDHFETVQKAAQRRVDAANAKATKHLAELETARKTSGKPSEEDAKAIELTRKERDELKAELQRVAYERTPEFRERYTDRETNIRQLAEAAAKDAGIDPKLIANAMAASGKHRFEILESAEPSLTAGTLAYVSNLLATYDQVQIEKSSALSQSKERYASYQQQEQAQAKAQEAERKQREEAAFDGALKKLSAQFEPFRKVEGNEPWNKGIDDDIAAARKLYNDGNASEEELAEVALTAIGAKKLHKMFKTLQARYNALAQKNAELTAAGPQVNGTGQHRTSADDSHLTEEQRSMRIYEESMRAAGRM